MQEDITMLEAFVEEKLGGQKRQSGDSNALHARRVRAILEDAFAQTGERPDDADIIVYAALGHDLIEDSDATDEQIIDLSCEQALVIIKELTNDEGDKTHSSAYVAKMITSSEEARLIKYADLIDNTFHASFDARGLGVDWMRSFFLPIIDPMTEALEQTTFEKYPQTVALLRHARSLARAHLETSIAAYMLKPDITG